MMRGSLIVLLAVITALSIGLVHYRSESTLWRVKAEHARQQAEKTEHQIQAQRIQFDQLAEMDKKHYQELTHARQRIEALRLDVARGFKRLRVNATCPKESGTPSSSGVDDGASPKLTPDAEQAYYTLREQIATVTAQILGLQGYIKTQRQ
ncbi:MAG: lysis protein [Candidatus Phlomobacter fragariae]